MLALVHPFNPSPDVPHRPVPSRKPSSSQLLSSSSSVTRPPPATLANHPPIHRHQPAPTASAVHFQPQRPPSSSAAPAASSSRPTPPPRSATPTPPPPAPFDIHSYPSTDLLKLLASLLTQIAATNDHLAPNASPSPAPHTPPIDTHAPIWLSLTSASRSAISTPASTLTFHARNIPTITLEAYLLRILKYCPTTNHVFLSLLVYFDRMSKLSQDATTRSFVIDSYNIHRLVIAGVTVASKFFSDVFYTNSRYAKVGGLPLPELNQLELQFLLLNDFRLVISTAEMQRYAEQLILFSRSSGVVVSTPLPVLSPSITPSVPTSGSAVASVPAPSINGHHAPTIAKSSSTSAPMRAMGAIDAYGGQVPEDGARVGYANREGGVLMNYQAQSTPKSKVVEEDWDAQSTASSSADDTETETEGSTTDDEPTIRPAHSERRGSMCSERSEWSESGDADEKGRPGSTERNGRIAKEEDDDESMASDSEVEGYVEGDKTPDRLGRGRGVRSRVDDDHRMGSP
ncbi:cyclin-domain-containing protein [Crucibulum laeve]|uniref:Cyclin-domain-containing protein n=1 Tax=Crucibulum laeve TaxID=68775 RepID=A0A5C3MF41_9AGAR|nr:cyclin-domain-containing protein [Crucibulum laeve]